MKNFTTALQTLNNTLALGETHITLYIEEDGDYLYSNSSMSNVFFNKTEAIDFCTNIVFEDYFEEHDVECDWALCKKEVIANSNITV